MYYTVKVQGHVRVDPKLFSLSIEKGIKASLQEKFEGFISKDVGIVIGVHSVDTVGEGVVISGDGAAYYDAKFSVISFKPEVASIEPAVSIIASKFFSILSLYWLMEPSP